MHSRKKETLDFIVQWVIVFLAFVGIALITCPIWANFFNDLKNEATMREFQKEQLSTQQLAKENAKRENKVMSKALANPYSEVGLKALPITNPNTNKELIKHTIGEIYLPTIHIQMPIFDSVEDKFMEHGAGWLNGSNFPDGGDGTHTVITGHSGIPTARLFTDVPNIKEDDLFILFVGNKYLAYKVYDIREVKPNDTTSIKREKGRDLATLVTCVPIGINSKRLLVTGTRVPFTPETLEKIKKIKAEETIRGRAVIIGIIAFVALFLFIAIWMILHWMMKRQRRDLTFVVARLGVHPGDRYALFSEDKKILYRKEKPFVVLPDVETKRVTFTDLPRGNYLVRQMNGRNDLPKFVFKFEAKGNFQRFVFKLTRIGRVKSQRLKKRI
ncbi:MAG: class C sortase [Lactobacillales bacterium]|jgi:sortase A|nr:class C sortase [Lactobacillales bacterium]